MSSIPSGAQLGSALARRLPLVTVAWRWWVGELAALMPPTLQRYLARSRGRAVLVILGDGLAEVVLESADRRESLATLDLLATPPAEAARILQLAGARGGIALRLPARDALRRKVSLPLAAERNLAQAVSFELERHIPFRRTDVYHAMRQVHRDLAARRLAIELTVAPRRAVDDALEAARGLGIDILSVEAAGADPDEPTSPNLLEQQARRGMPSARGIALGMLGLAGLLLAGAAIAIPLHRSHDEADALAAIVADARRQADESQHLKAQIDARVEENDFLAGRKRRSPAISNVIDVLTRLLPDDTWLTELYVKGGDVEISGLSGSASSIIGVIDRSLDFASPSFRSPVTQDSQTHREQFDIAARFVVGGAP